MPGNGDGAPFLGDDALMAGIKKMSVSGAEGICTIISRRDSLSFLPDEVVEEIVIGICDQPSSVAALAQTCRRCRAVIYQPADSFLWREIFLLKYDDPRRTPFPLKLHVIKDFDWGHEYRQRIWATNHLRRVPLDDTDDDTSVETAEDDAQNLRALHALHSLIDTALPITGSPMEPKMNVHEQWNTISFARSHALAPLSPPTPGLFHTPARNVTEYHEAIAHGLPSAVLRHLSTQEINAEWDATPVAQTVYKLVAHHALISGTKSSYWEPFNAALKMPSLVTHKRAYRMDYLQRHCMYGPFKPCILHSGSDDSDPKDTFQFVPDWTQLAAIGLLMRTVLDSEDDSWMSKYQQGADAFRSGAWNPHGDSGIGSDEDRQQVNRDWAGVGGVWRRLETWLAYDVLTALNQPDFHSLAELSRRARHIVPARLRVVSYTQNPSGPPRFPTIHFEGETGKESWSSAASTDSDICHIDGAVSMLADGSVRWSFYMYTDNRDSEKQWSFEGVQVGGIGSLAGIIGLWTGASHLSGDPLGHWWQWRVA